MSTDNPSLEFGLAVHFFHTVRVRHWVAQQVFLSPEFLIIKLYASIANIALDYVPSQYPSQGAFGAIPLPAAFIHGRACGAEGILKFLRSLVEIDQLHASSISDPRDEREPLMVHAAAVIQEAISFTLFASDAYQRYTRPVVLDSMLSRPAAELFLRDQRQKWVDRESSLIAANLEKLLKHIVSSKLSRQKFLFSDSAPSLCDLVVYAYLSVLFAIPEEYTPFECIRNDGSDEDISENVHRLKGFLLDFDDWLWTSRKARPEDNQPIRTSLLAAQGNANCDEPHSNTDESAAVPVSKPFFGKDSAARNSNLAFLGFMGASAAILLAIRSH